ncbi:MAG: thermonuclease family protein [Burkholderiaceae bacterium]
MTAAGEARSVARTLFSIATASATRRRVLLVLVGSMGVACRPGAGDVGATDSERPAGPVGPLRIGRVADGDSFELFDAAGRPWRVRLAGIDAPERSQAYGLEARQRLVKLLGDGSQLRVQPLKKDVYGRLVADLVVRGEDVGRAMLAAGAAWHFRRYANEQPADQRQRYAAAEREARARGLGLWRDPKPEPPWDYRARRRRTDS